MSDSAAVAADRVLEAWNARRPADAAADILPCNGSQAWAAGTAAARPISSPETLLQTADAVWLALDERDWQQAFDSHPRLGETKAAAASGQSLSWSRGEQSTLMQGTWTHDLELQTALARANRAYEARFGRIFLLCATGKRTEEVLACLESRLSNDPATELRVAAGEQRRITQLRLRKWLGLPSAGCGDV